MEPALAHELVMAAPLDQPAVLEHLDAIGVSERAQAADDDDRRPVPAPDPERFPDALLGRRIDEPSGASLFNHFREQ